MSRFLEIAFIFFVLLACTVAGWPALPLNGSFEQGKEGWVLREIVSPSTFEIKTDGAKYGEKYAVVSGGQSFVYSAYFDVVAGQSYTLTAWARGQGKLNLGILWLYGQKGMDMASPHSEQMPVAAKVRDKWHQFTASYIASEGATRACIRLVISDGEVQLDEVQVSEGAPFDKPGWRLTFHDEFAGTELDLTRWNPRYRNQQSRRALYVVKDGCLRLRMDCELPQGPAGTISRVSSVETRFVEKPFNQQYGWFEIRAKCAAGTGRCSAFWMNPIDSSYKKLKEDGGTRSSPEEAMEIDIFEQLGREPNRNYFTVHFGRSYQQDHRKELRRPEFPFDFSTEFHIFALEWNEQELIWYVDGEEVFRSDKTAHAPYFIFLSYYESSATSSGSRGPVDESTVYPMDFVIDYVRVYQRAE